MKVRLPGALIAVLIAASCSSGSTGTPAATPTIPSAAPTPSVSSISITGTAPKVGQSAQFTAAATLSNGTTQAITSQATWQSSNSGIITVSTFGVVIGVAAGEADVTATYSGVTGSQHLIVIAQTYGLVGVISDDSTGRGIAGARVEALNGLNAGKAVSTDASGGYVFDALLADSFRMRASANNYDPGEQGVTVPAIPRADFTLRQSCFLTVAPLRLWVTSGGMITPTSQISVTASAPACTWTAANLPNDWLYMSTAPVFRQSDGGHSVAGTGSAIVYLASNASALIAPQHTSTIRFLWRGGEADVIACQPNCFAP